MTLACTPSPPLAPRASWAAANVPPAPSPPPGEHPSPRRFKRVCPECGVPHLAAKRSAEFCSGACRKAFNNRRLIRGAELYDLFMTLRHERPLAKALGVWRLLCRFSQAYREEDVRQRDGRPSWRPAKEVIARRPYLHATNLGTFTWKKPDVR